VDSLRGQLLIAAPALLDPNFLRTVVLLSEHTDEGALGLVLNRPSDVAVSAAVEELGELIGEDEPVYVGGPVEPSQVVVLAEFDEPDSAAALVFADVGFLTVAPEVGPTDIRRRRLYAGYAGWDAGQLEAELEQGAWIVEPPVSDDIFTDEPDELWRSVLHRKGGRYALIALMPVDPSVN
jgi:putative transcriptional regulator